MSNNTNNNNNEYTNTYYNDDGDNSIYFLYFIFFLGTVLYCMPYVNKGIKALCDKNEDSEYESENDCLPDEAIQMETTNRELKPDYDSNDDEENKYI